jgi:DNA repair ATPase RecN
MSKDSDLYGDDIRLWSEMQSDLLRRLSAGEAVADQVDWPHVVDEIEHSHAQPPERDEIAQLTARLIAAEALVKELRSRLDDVSGKLGATKAELAAAQDEAETATARAVAATEAEQAIRKADANRRARSLVARLRAAWRGE